MQDEDDEIEMCRTMTQYIQKLNISKQILSEFNRKELINRKDEI